MRELHGLARGKLNLVLEVLGRRDDGYHELATVMQTLALADRVTVSLEGPAGVSVGGPYADGVPAGDRNLAWQAAHFLAERTGNDIGALHIALDKQIPSAAGLGGGASDAATVLRLLQQAWGNVGDDDLLEAANATGSDEAFFLTGGTALVRGRGEHVEPLADLPAHDVVLFVPPETLEQKTAQLFKALAGGPYDDGSATAHFLARHPGSVDVARCYNGFKRVADGAFPGLAALRRSLETATGTPLLLAGAGPTLAWIGAPGAGAAIAARAAGLNCDVLVTSTAESQWER